MLRRYIFCLTLPMILFSCAKERPIEKVGEGAVVDKRFAKGVFTNDTDDPQFALTGQATGVKKWLFKQTIVNTSENASIVFTGFQRQMQLGYFEFSEERLSFNSGLSVYGDKTTTIDKHIASWPITHSEYQLKKSGGRVTNAEEEDPYLTWDQKNFFTIDFEKGNFAVEMLSMMGYPKKCFEAKEPHLVDGATTVSPEHVAFTIAMEYRFDFDECLDFPNVRQYLNQEDFMSVEIRMSFKPLRQVVSEDYEPYRYEGEFDPLNAKYGYFKTRVEAADDQDIFQNVYLMNRWNPQQDASKPQRIYFDKDFPQQYKWIYNDPKLGVIARTNQLLEKQGLPTRFAIDDVPEGVNFGDVGVSFIKYVKELDQGAPLGYGPSDANPLTGEIVSANTILWGGLLGNYLKRIKQEVQADGDRFASSHLYYQMRQTLNVGEVYTPEQIKAGDYQNSWINTAAALRPELEAGDAFHFLLPEFTFGYYGYPQAYMGQPGSNFISDPTKFTAFMQEKLFDDRVFDQATNLMSPQILRPIQNTIKNVRSGIHDYFAQEMIDYNNSSRSTIYAMDASLASAQDELVAGRSLDDILNTILYRVAIHEFGHNLGLRHNFYGSVDAKNFRNRGDGQQQSTASVMDYQDLTDEMDEAMDWEAYDYAALTYAYSSGKIDLGKNNKTTYLYCTDEHRLTNAMCAAWDRGTTPSEVALSIIKRYESLYWVRNFRFDRPFWYTGGYAASVFQTMWDLKKFLPMHDQTFNLPEVKTELAVSKWKALIDDGTVESRIVEPIKRDMKQANLLAAAFYHALIQQSTKDRDWLDLYDDFTGALEIKGILYDKVYALFFLIGDAAFSYDLNTQMQPLTYTTLFNDGVIGNQLEEIFSKTVTEQVAAEQGFESLARTFYAINAGSYLNRLNDASLIERIRIACYRPESLKRRLGIDPKLLASKDPDTDIFENQVDQAEQPELYFQGSRERIGVTNIDGNYFVAMEHKNSYAFNMIKTLKNYPIGKGYKKDEVRDFYNYYNVMTKNRLPECL